jgi:hypothetical protein
MRNYNSYLDKVCQLYDCDKKTCEDALKQAWMAFLSPDELEEFILEVQWKEIKKQEMKLNRMEQEEIRPSKKNSKRKNKQFPYKRNCKIPFENRNKTKHLNSPND